MHPSVSQVTMLVVWIRYTIMTAEMLNEFDNNVPQDCNEVMQQKIDKYCIGLEDLMEEWKLDSLMNNVSQNSEMLRYLVADHVRTPLHE